jgi:hypothetical protein
VAVVIVILIHISQFLSIMLQEINKGKISRQHQSTGPSFVKKTKRRKQNTVTLVNAIKRYKKTETRAPLSTATY